MTRPFDCSIDLTMHTVPSTVPPDQAIRRVRKAIEALPGAGWISVTWCGDAPPELPWLRLYQPGEGGEQTGNEWDALATDIRAATRGALASMRR